MMRVIFRTERSGDFAGEVTAVFPDLYGWHGHLSCYSAIGQHSAACEHWYQNRTRPATEAEYAPLLAELRSIYETGPDAVNLVVSKRR